MKTTFTFVILLLSLISNSQEYKFDYVLDVEYTEKEGEEPSLSTYYINSENNNYIFRSVKNNDGTISLQFHNNHGVVAEDFNNNYIKNLYSLFTFECRKVFDYKSLYSQKQLKNYRFEVYNDTIIDNVAYAHYAIKHNNTKTARKKKIGDLHYIVHKETTDCKPVLLFNTAPLTLYNANNQIPNGIYKESYFIMPDGEKKHIRRVLSYSKKSFTVKAEKCK